MTDKQPEALRIADAFGIPHWTGLPIALHVEAAAELRRLHEVNAELVGALEEAAENIAEWGAYASEYFQNKYDLQGDIDKARAALHKAQGDNNG